MSNIKMININELSEEAGIKKREQRIRRKDKASEVKIIKGSSSWFIKNPKMINHDAQCFVSEKAYAAAIILTNHIISGLDKETVELDSITRKIRLFYNMKFVEVEAFVKEYQDVKQ